MSDQDAVWAIIEVMGHRSYAGKVSEHHVAGAGFVRIEIPEVDGKGGGVKLLGPKSIFAFHLTTEEIAMAYVARSHEQAIDVFARLGRDHVPALAGGAEYDDSADWEDNDRVRAEARDVVIDEMAALPVAPTMDAAEVAGRWIGISSSRIESMAAMLGLSFPLSDVAFGVLDRELRSRGFKRATEPWCCAIGCSAKGLWSIVDPELPYDAAEIHACDKHRDELAAPGAVVTRLAADPEQSP